jgi:transcriptional regulator with XRE-family HTH domain
MLRTPPISNTCLAGIIRDLRLRRKFSVKEVSKRTGYSQQFILDVEHDKTGTIDFSVLLVMLDALEYDLLIAPRERSMTVVEPHSKAESRKA